MKRNDDPAIVSLETHRRRRVAETRAKAVQARKARTVGVQGEKAINWRRVPLALGAIVLLLAASWLVGKLLH